ncbi:AbrB/MazE/SpoVT family DNA-binding domain-containing protein [Lacticaseibacillus paracasei]|uniref:AbrB/MazE/SpoVT family DNA-binding domain-containing protein n=1 Tax=Lacticaseibacillus paracasei TaxID=1597 RepID=UPI0015FBC406|nr:AbrB/MazE/SpoVT family DNA-binding domain-containing protein [Lacticaseibacillus paracasei]MBB1167711.1 AbrB/MazE/SpoVT family DNA-binding domain-containing protein [Lacticaseibacillus paracasei]
MSIIDRDFMEATMTSKGQVTIPVEIRRRSGIKKNTKVRFELKQDGDIEMRVVNGHNSEDEKELLHTIQGLIGQYRTVMAYLKDR